jgi:ParB family chromosome partitioning protein
MAGDRLMKGRDILKDLTQAKGRRASADNPQHSRQSGSVRALKNELDKIADDAAEARELKESIAKGGQVVDLSPEIIDGAFIGDRIPVLNDQKFDELKKSILDAGQQVPILVRSKPNNSEGYEAAYGHRRIRVASELGIPVRAIVRALTDREMILAQGQENGPRLDLSFIERALYASRLLKHGHDRNLVCHALSVDKPEVSRLLQVADGIEESIILAIGPARKIGRPRWVQLVKFMQDREFLEAVAKLIISNHFQEIGDSNLKFEEVLKLNNKFKKPLKVAKKFTKTALQGAKDSKYGWFEKTTKGVSIVVDNKHMSEFLLVKLPDLVKEYESLQRPKSK